MTRLGDGVVVIAFIVSLYALFTCLHKSLDVPVVQVSASTGKCVQILDRGEVYECLNDIEGLVYTVEYVK